MSDGSDEPQSSTETCGVEARKESHRALDASHNPRSGW